MKSEQPITSIARKLLKQRLKSVAKFTRLAAKHADRDVEYVHQLRVSTRRGRAALQVFGDLIPRKHAKKMKETLRSLRLAANDARDIDVLLARLEQLSNGKKKGHFRAMTNRLRKRRVKAQRPLQKRYRELKDGRFESSSQKLLKSIQWKEDRPEPTLKEAVPLVLAPLLDDFLSAELKTATDLQTFHRMRIAAKKIRYALELLDAALSKRRRKRLLKILERVQERLGYINDRCNAISEFQQWTDSNDDKKEEKKVKKLIGKETRALEKACREFVDWWTDERSSELRKEFERIESDAQ